MRSDVTTLKSRPQLVWTMRVVLAGGVLVLVALSGCAGTGESGVFSTRSGGRAGGGLSDGAPAFAADWVELALPFEPGHDHLDVHDHRNLSTPNFEIIGYDPLITDYYGTSAGDYFCGDVRERDGRSLAVVESWGSDIAFVLIDVTDPAEPKKIGELAMANTQVYDVAMTPDQKFVLLSTWPFDSGPDQTPDPLGGGAATFEFRDACTGETRPLRGPESGLPFTDGVVLVDIQNPRNPIVVDFRSFPPLGGHSIQIAELDGRTIILVSGLNFVHQISYYVFMEIIDLAGPKLNILSFYQYIPEDGAPPVASSLHDGFLAEHPVTGENLAYLAYAGTGLVIVNIDNPAAPRLVSHWNDDGGDLREVKPTGMSVHGVVPAKELWDGRHYSIVGEECSGRPAQMPTCLVAVLDTTDPEAPAFVGAWTLPVDVQWSSGYQFSPHYFDLVGRTLFISLYHGGLWAVDLSMPDALRRMPSVGVFLPDLESPKPARNYRSALNQALLTALAADVTNAPMVMDLNPLSDGTLVVYDNTSGVYTVRFHADRPAPAPEPWPLGYNEA